MLRSWAVPKGPSLDPAEKRLAVQVPDHPLSYADFEGRLGPGYGEGAVIVWDMGDVRAADRGRLRRRAATTGTRRSSSRGASSSAAGRCGGRSGGRKPKWLLIKKRDEHAGDGDRAVAESVLSGRTIEDL